MDTPEPTVCSNCIEALVDTTFIECADCSRSGSLVDDGQSASTSTASSKTRTLRLCVDCFSSGAELGSHKRTHRYYVRSPGDELVLFPGQLLEADGRPWSIREELGLLDGIERFNLGNWEDVSNHYVKPGDPGGRKRRSREILEHYDRFYLHGALGRSSMAGLKRPDDRDHTSPLTLSIDNTSAEASTFVPIADQPSPPMKEALRKISSDDFRLLAYMPQRDDFEKEFNNDAEALISNLMILPDDDDLDKAVKVAQIEMYVREVAERRRRKLIARDYDLVSGFLKQEKSFTTKATYSYSIQEQKKLKVERDLKDQLRKSAQFIPSSEFDELVAGVIKERTLKERIKELQDYHREGKTTLEGEKRLKASENLISSRPSNEDVPNVFDLLTEPKKMSIDGIECDSGKNDWPKRTSDGGIQNSTLSRTESELCNGYNISSQDYVLLKTALFKEQAAKARGLPLRTNVGLGGGVDNVLKLKSVVKAFMKGRGWLPYYC